MAGGRFVRVQQNMLIPCQEKEHGIAVCDELMLVPLRLLG
ncbi:hypothetical protein EBBID32_31730 [Sphingobium indicum BiD32]|uniref:Uncharacterized protein n=1 Tax=Sphingobium indicum BiD32 TaxID=1301087 RepID=N1MPF9_9SPHN|nr:hypothetical protein EBBID32_31730 [Sphingobium indicum BiD32]